MHQADAHGRPHHACRRNWVSAARSSRRQCVPSTLGTLRAGLDAPSASPEEVAKYTVQVMLRTVPPAVPGIHHLSGAPVVQAQRACVWGQRRLRPRSGLTARRLSGGSGGQVHSAGHAVPCMHCLLCLGCASRQVRLCVRSGLMVNMSGRQRWPGSDAGHAAHDGALLCPASAHWSGAPVIQARTKHGTFPAGRHWHPHCKAPHCMPGLHALPASGSTLPGPGCRERPSAIQWCDPVSAPDVKAYPRGSAGSAGPDMTTVTGSCHWMAGALRVGRSRQGVLPDRCMQGKLQGCLP